MLRLNSLWLSIAFVVGCDSTTPGWATAPAPAAPVAAAHVPATSPLTPPTAPAKIPVAFVLSPGAEVVDWSGPWGVFEYAFVPGYEGTPFQLYTVAEQASPLKVSGGLTVVPDYTFTDAPTPKVIVVPAQEEPTEAELAWLRREAPGAALTMSVCNGAFVLAKAGLLDGKEATAHHGAYAYFAAEFPAIRVKRGARFVDAGGVSTAGGLTSGIDLALHVVERFYGRQVAVDTADALEYQGQGWKDPDSNAAYATPRVSTVEHPICPVCSMPVDRATSPHEDYRGTTYYFCSPEDQAAFDRHPDRYAAAP